MPDPDRAGFVDHLTLAGDAAWQTDRTDDLFDAIMALPDRGAAERFFRDLCTLRELHDLAQRWQVVRLLEEGRHYGEIAQLTGASTATITRIASWLRHGTGGYREALERRRLRGSAAGAAGAAGNAGGSAAGAAGAAGNAGGSAGDAGGSAAEPSPTTRRSLR